MGVQALHAPALAIVSGIHSIRDHTLGLVQKLQIMDEGHPNSVKTRSAVPQGG